MKQLMGARERWGTTHGGREMVPLGQAPWIAKMFEARSYAMLLGCIVKVSLMGVLAVVRRG